MHVFTYRTANITIRTEMAVSLSIFWRKSFEEFQVDNALQPDITYCFYRVEPDSLTLPPLSAEETEVLFKGRHSFSESPLLSSPLVRARLLQASADYPDQVYFEPRPFSVNLFDFVRREHDMFWAVRIEDFMRLCNIHPSLYSTLLPLYSSLMVHSSAVVRNGVTALFVATDGGGKTTVARLATPSTILSDDHVLLRKEEGAVKAFGTPWGMFVNRTESARVGGVFLLEWADQFDLTPLQPSEMLRFLWDEHSGYYSPLPNKYRTWVFNFLAELCSTVPVYRLRFVKGHVDWNAIDAALK